MNSTSPRTVLVTGGNTGIGAAFAAAIARPGVHVVLACRSAGRAEAALAAVRGGGATASFLELDLADLTSADAAARAFARDHDALDLLVDNAGLAGQRGTTSDGWELAFGVNHLGHFAFTLPLLPLLERSRGSVVVVSSGSHYQAKAIRWGDLRQPTKSTTGMAEYEVSKVCNILFTAELRRRHPSVGAVAVHPGRIASDIWRPVPWPVRAVLPRLLCMKSVEAGAQTLVRAAELARDPASAPLYLHELEPRAPSRLALDAALAEELWSRSEDALAAALSRRAAA